MEPSDTELCCRNRAALLTSSMSTKQLVKILSICALSVLNRTAVRRHRMHNGPYAVALVVLICRDLVSVVSVGDFHLTDYFRGSFSFFLPSAFILDAGATLPVVVGS